MSVPRTVAEVIHEHVTLEVEGIDRMYLNVYQPKIAKRQAGGVVSSATIAASVLLPPPSWSPFPKPSSTTSRPMSNSATSRSSPSKRRKRKDDLAAAYRAKFEKDEGIYLVGKAQEKIRAFAPRNARTPSPAKSIPGSSAPPPWSTSLLLRRRPRLRAVLFKFSSTSLQTPSCASTVTSIASGNWPRKRSPSQPWTTAFLVR